MRLVVIESPYAGDVERNMRYLAACMHDCLLRGEAPYASHGLYTMAGCLDDDVPEERTLGINAGLAWGDKAELRAVYGDLGFSRGMQLGIDRALAIGQAVEIRSLKGWVEANPPVARRESRPLSTPEGDYHCMGCASTIARGEDYATIPTKLGFCYAHERCRKRVEETVKRGLYALTVHGAR